MLDVVVVAPQVLVQLAGTKEIVIFPPHFTDQIDGGHYVSKFDSRQFFSDDAIAASPALSTAPYFRVRLGPGMAVSIPSGA